MVAAFVLLALSLPPLNVAGADETKKEQLFRLTAEPEPEDRPWEKGAQIGRTESSTQSSWATKAALTTKLPDFDLLNLGWTPSVAGRVNRNTQTPKEINLYGADLAAETAIDFGNWGLVPGVRFAYNRDKSNQGPQRKQLLAAASDIVAKDLALGVTKPLGPFEYAFMPILGAYHWRSSEAPSPSVAVGRESGILGRLDAVLRGSQSSIKRQAPFSIQRFELRGTIQRWWDFSASGGIQERNYRNNVVALTYRLYDPPLDPDKAAPMIKPTISLKRVSGENPEQGQARQAFAQLVLQIEY